MRYKAKVWLEFNADSYDEANDIILSSVNEDIVEMAEYEIYEEEE